MILDLLFSLRFTYICSYAHSFTLSGLSATFTLHYITIKDRNRLTILLLAFKYIENCTLDQGFKQILAIF